MGKNKSKAKAVARAGSLKEALRPGVPDPALGSHRPPLAPARPPCHESEQGRQPRAQGRGRIRTDDSSKTRGRKPWKSTSRSRVHAKLQRCSRGHSNASLLLDVTIPAVVSRQ